MDSPPSLEDYDPNEWEECEDEDDPWLFWWRLLISMIAITLVGLFFWLLEEHKRRQRRRSHKEDAASQEVREGVDAASAETPICATVLKGSKYEESALYRKEVHVVSKQTVTANASQERFVSEEAAQRGGSRALDENVDITLSSPESNEEFVLVSKRKKGRSSSSEEEEEEDEAVTIRKVTGMKWTPKDGTEPITVDTKVGDSETGTSGKREMETNVIKIQGKQTAGGGESEIRIEETTVTRTSVGTFGQEAVSQDKDLDQEEHQQQGFFKTAMEFVKGTIGFDGTGTGSQEVLKPETELEGHQVLEQKGKEGSTQSTVELVQTKSERIDDVDREGEKQSTGRLQPEKELSDLQQSQEKGFSQKDSSSEFMESQLKKLGGGTDGEVSETATLSLEPELLTADEDKKEYFRHAAAEFMESQMKKFGFGKDDEGSAAATLESVRHAAAEFIEVQLQKLKIEKDGKGPKIETLSLEPELEAADEEKKKSFRHASAEFWESQLKKFRFWKEDEGSQTVAAEPEQRAADEDQNESFRHAATEFIESQLKKLGIGKDDESPATATLALEPELQGAAEDQKESFGQAATEFIESELQKLGMRKEGEKPAVATLAPEAELEAAVEEKKEPFGHAAAEFIESQLKKLGIGKDDESPATATLALEPGLQGAAEDQKEPFGHAATEFIESELQKLGMRKEGEKPAVATLAPEAELEAAVEENKEPFGHAAAAEFMESQINKLGGGKYDEGLASETLVLEPELLAADEDKKEYFRHAAAEFMEAQMKKFGLGKDGDESSATERLESFRHAAAEFIEAQLKKFGIGKKDDKGPATAILVPEPELEAAEEDKKQSFRYAATEFLESHLKMLGIVKDREGSPTATLTAESELRTTSEDQKESFSHAAAEFIESQMKKLGIGKDEGSATKTLAPEPELQTMDKDKKEPFGHAAMEFVQSKLEQFGIGHLESQEKITTETNVTKTTVQTGEKGAPTTHVLQTADQAAEPGVLRPESEIQTSGEEKAGFGHSAMDFMQSQLEKLGLIGHEEKDTEGEQVLRAEAELLGAEEHWEIQNQQKTVVKSITEYLQSKPDSIDQKENEDVLRPEAELSHPLGTQDDDKARIEVAVEANFIKEYSRIAENGPEKEKSEKEGVGDVIQESSTNPTEEGRAVLPVDTTRLTEDGLIHEPGTDDFGTEKAQASSSLEEESDPSGTTAPEIESFVADSSEELVSNLDKAGDRDILESEELPDDPMITTTVTTVTKVSTREERFEERRAGIEEGIPEDREVEEFKRSRTRGSAPRFEEVESTDAREKEGSASESSGKQSKSERKISSMLEVVGVTSLADALLKMQTLDEVSEVMRKAGLQSSNLIFGIDYTASNKYQGEKSFNNQSLHSIRPGIQNPYQQVITIMGKTLAPFATSGYIPVFGFGDVHTSDWSVFPLQKDVIQEEDEDGEQKVVSRSCYDFDEVLEVYNAITPKVILSGPTNFAPLIYQSIEICKAVRDYHILVICADGQVTNERATRRAIVEACQYPLSIIVVGVGDGPWDMMRVFDDSLPKRPWDNFHFVEFHKIMKDAGDNPDLAFAVQTLLEIPDQYKKIKEMGLLNL